MVGLATAPTTPVPASNKAAPTGDQAADQPALTANTDAPGTGKTAPNDAPQPATAPKPAGTPAGGTPSAIDGMAKGGPAPSGKTSAGAPPQAAANPAASDPAGAHVPSAGGGVQDSPAGVGDIVANVQPTLQSGTGKSQSRPTATGETTANDPPAALAGSKPSDAKSLDADALTKTAAEGAATVKNSGAAQADGAVQTAGNAATQNAGKDAKPPVMAVISPAEAGTQAPTSANAQTPASAPATPATPVAAEAALPAAASTTAAPGSAPAQAAAAAAANGALAEASPAGRFAQARQGVDERDNNVAAARSKGKSTANGAQNATSQAGAKHQAAGASPPPPSASNSQAARPDAAAVVRDLPASAPPPPAATTAPLAADPGRMPTVSVDPALTAGTDTGPGSVRGTAHNAAATGAGQTPRFSPHTANQLAAQISQRFANGSRVFGIRLDPAELGRVDIRLELSHTNRVHATLTVERGDTLAEMQRSTRELERALNDAGLELAEDGLTFQLSEGAGDQHSANPEQGSNFNIYGQDDDGAQDLAAEIDSGPGDAYGFRLSRRDGVDLRV